MDYFWLVSLQSSEEGSIAALPVSADGFRQQLDENYKPRWLLHSTLDWVPLLIQVYAKHTLTRGGQGLIHTLASELLELLTWIIIVTAHKSCKKVVFNTSYTVSSQQELLLFFRHSKINLKGSFFGLQFSIPFSHPSLLSYTRLWFQICALLRYPFFLRFRFLVEYKHLLDSAPWNLWLREKATACKTSLLCESSTKPLCESCLN